MNTEDREIVECLGIAFFHLHRGLENLRAGIPRDDEPERCMTYFPANACQCGMYILQWPEEEMPFHANSY